MIALFYQKLLKTQNSKVFSYVRVTYEQMLIHDDGKEQFVLIN